MAKSFVLAITCLAAAVSARPSVIPPRSSLTTQSNQVKECVNGKWHTTTFNTTGYGDEVMVDLDNTDHLRHVTCDLDGTRLQLKFSNVIYAAEYLVRFHDLNDHFLVGGIKWNCSVAQRGTPGLIIRRIVGADQDGDTLNVRASEARYDEIYEDADISFRSEGSCNEDEASKDKEVCIGFNTECQGTATKSLPIWQNQFVTLACSDCFVDFSMDVFVDVHIRGWEVANLSVGFRNMNINSSAVIDAKADANWNTGIDKILPLLQNEYLINFKVGVVPFMVYFDLPVELTGSFTFNSAAEATFGTALNVGLGDAFVSWNPTQHWTHSHPQPAVYVHPTLTTSASVDAQGTLALIPKLTAHFDRILAYELLLTPTLDVTVQGSEASKKVCLNSNYDISFTTTTTLDINIPWANIAKDWQWKKDVYESGTKTIEQKCINL